MLRALADRAKARKIDGVKVYYSVSGRHLRNTILRFEHLRRFEPYCLFFGATERELATRARAEGRSKIVHFVPNFFFELDRSIPEHRTVDTFITTVSPMDDAGYFSFGTNADYSCVMCRQSTRIVVEGLLPGSGDKVSIETDAFEARALQHEIDHCAGLLFLDRVAGAHAVHPRKTYL